MKRGLYLVEGAGFHKIGMTSNFDQRFYQLRLQVPFALRLLAFKPLAFQRQLRPAELDLHRRFEASRVRPRSEWFQLNPAQLQECIELLSLEEPPPSKKSKEREGHPIFSQEWAEECLERMRNPVAFSVALSCEKSDEL